MSSRWLSFYAFLFAAVGLCFLVLPNATLACLAWSVRARIPLAGQPSLWLGLAGSLMAVLTLAAWELARDPAQGAVWRLLIASKAVSAFLFLDFAHLGGGRPYLAAACVDGAIFLHLWLLKWKLEPLETWTPRGARHEAWFLTFRDPASGAAFWLRRSREGRVPCCWWAVTDLRTGTWQRGRWDGAGRFAHGLFAARGPEARWELSWDDGPVPPYALVPRWLWGLGMAYVTAAPAASFSGWLEAGGKRWEVKDAPGCVGHLWGGRRGARWRWAHAWLPEVKTMVEVLVARGPFGPTLRSAALWRGGRLSTGLRLGGPGPQGDVTPPGWSFSVPLGGAALEGVCHAEPGLVMEVAYGAGKERVDCRHSTAGSLAASWRQGPGAPEWDVAARGTAAVESADRA